MREAITSPSARAQAPSRPSSERPSQEDRSPNPWSPPRAAERGREGIVRLGTAPWCAGAWRLETRPDDDPRLHDLPLAPQARRARQPLLPREHIRAARELGRSPPPRPCADSLRGVGLPLPLPQPVQRRCRLPRHAALLDLPDPSARDLRGGRLHLPALPCAPSAQRRSGRMGGCFLVADGHAGGGLPGLRLERDPDRAARALLLGRARLDDPRRDERRREYRSLRDTLRA